MKIALKYAVNRSKLYYGLINGIGKRHTFTDNSQISHLDQESDVNKKTIKKLSSNRTKNDVLAPPVSRRIPIPPIIELSSSNQSIVLDYDCNHILKKYFMLDGDPDNKAPSICMYTMLQAHSLAICACIAHQKLAVGFDDGTIVIWSLSENKPLRCIKPACDLEDIDPCCSNISDFIYDSKTQRHSYTLFGHRGDVNCLNFSSCGFFLISGGNDCTIRLWSLHTMSCLVVYKGHYKAVLDLKFGPFDYYFASASVDRSARLWAQDQVNSIRIFTDEFHNGEVLCIDFHPNAHYLATGCEDRYVRIFDLAAVQQDTNSSSAIDNQRLCVRTFSGHKSHVTRVKFTDCGTYVISIGGVDGLVCIFSLIWTSSTTSAPAYIVNVLRQSSPNSCICNLISISPDGSQVAVAGDTDGSLHVWDLEKAICNDKLIHSQSEELLISTQRTKSTVIVAYEYITPQLIIAFGRLDSELSDSDCSM
ncbi:hypothetical protein GJ496_011346 [Pomphorhynchus laevis]|nr:hypothetical protein GJ496_011346 [Pomphorhynchus laevis]